MTTRRAKIVCTIGPASRSPDQLRALVQAGMDVARLNFSHGTHEEHGEVIAALRDISAQLGRPLALLQDLQGPKIRIGAFASGSIQLNSGAEFAITTDSVRGDPFVVSTPYAALTRDVTEGDHVLLSDGLLRLEVLSVSESAIRCIVRDGGVLHSRAGMNIPSAALSAGSLTAKDLDDLDFGLSAKVDYVALSFVRRTADVEELAAIIQARGAHAGTIAKLEKPQAIDDLDGIMAAADAVMIARGDLGVELSPERVPFVQKEIIRRAIEHRVPVITATQMLESMTEHPRPTRAEASDVANAILDGTDAVMLSGETAIGRYPVQAANMMHRIVLEAESQSDETASGEYRRRVRDEPTTFDVAVAQAASRVAAEIKAAAVLAFTQTGFTARVMSKHRPPTPIFAIVADDTVSRRVCLYWGVQPWLVPKADTLEGKVEVVDRALQAAGLINPGDSLVIIAGQPTQGTANLLRLHRAEQRE